MMRTYYYSRNMWLWMRLIWSIESTKADFWMDLITLSLIQISPSNNLPFVILDKSQRVNISSG